jgi:protein TonB
MIRVLFFIITFFAVSNVYSQRPIMRPVGGGESYEVVTDSMLRHEKYLYTDAEIRPSFLGGQDNFDLFVKKNLRYPIKAIKNNTQGKVTLSFIVERSGRLTHIAVMRGIGDGCDEEAVRLLKKSSKWSPGKIHDIPVRTQTSIGIKFLVSN